ncbi:MAG: hypothetical protein U0457_18015 [Candidatus Sericytochromatia bacterium]
MTDYALKGLYIPDNSQVNQNQEIKLKGLNKKKEEPQVEELSSVSAFLDSLSIANVKTGNSTTSNELESLESIESKKTKSVPSSLKAPSKSDLSILDQLMIPDQKTIPQSYSHSAAPKQPQKPISEVLSGLKPASITETSTQKKTTKYKLDDLDVSLTASRTRVMTTSADGTQSISKTYTIGAVVSPNDIAETKLNKAIDKINNWDRKVGALDSELKKQKSGEGSPDVLVTRSQQVAKAKREAIDSRQEALQSYNDAVKELKNLAANEQNIAKSEKYKQLYTEMERRFAEVTEKDASTWGKVTDYAKEVMSSDGFARFKELINPLNAFK